jgi:hypothetical protein
VSALCFLDTETTGVHPNRRPWEIAMILRDDMGQREVSIFVGDPDLSDADSFGLKIGRFYERHPQYRGGGNPYSPHFGSDRWEGLRLYPERRAAGIVESWTRGAHIVGAVPSFDTETLSALLRRNELIPAWHYHLIDVEALAVGYLAGQSSVSGVGVTDPRAGNLPWKSDDLSAMCGVEPPTEDERHTALGDARWAMRLYDKIMGDLS